MRYFGALLICAPLCLFGYGVIRLIGLARGDYGPGAVWQLAHVVALIGLMLFVAVVIGLGRLLPAGIGRTATVALTLIGLAAGIVQFGADIIIAAQASDHAEMARLSREFSAIAGVRAVVYTVVPQLFFLGLVVLAALLARRGRLPWWSPALLLVSVVLPAVALDLLPVAAVGVLVALRKINHSGASPVASL
ncbi:hypothetical protein [Nocardia pseudobrasiliensis]|uniref:Uncharacterized protein n=1 Tax=Nocardia pseudobrasiliensis TaxID=45979 RepID=A0A370HN26_9NOCA|nr:hypothetical protein [Nocardia pseudobrasiliensis]RDI59635.1 hypothetical protein DFR76_11826 [Nocardia pseudobrasiliensis]